MTKIRHAIKRMQYTNRILNEGTDAVQAKRIDDLAESVRGASKGIGESVQSLGQTE